MLIKKGNVCMNCSKHGSMEITRIKTFGWENALIGMRFPKNSEAKYDSKITWCPESGEVPTLGPQDQDLLFRLTKAGRDHRKVLRMIHVQMAVKMPISWWIHYDTYKVATVANSRSRMHKFGTAEIDETDIYSEFPNPAIKPLLAEINRLIMEHQNAKKREDKEAAYELWRRALELLPMSYCQERMIDLNYETLISIYHSRNTEKLGEWKFFIDTVLEQCPYLSHLCEASKNSRPMTTAEFEAKK